MEINVHKDVETFIASLEKNTIAKILRTLDLLERFGYRLGLPHSKKVHQKFFELRIRGQQEVRIFYILSNDQASLIHAFIKKSQKTPRLEINHALAKIKRLT